ncbi:hypothetical protein CEQ90_11840 [Lewinellaceae bacterium SD302]|nr:hypothetical protein CEQ90_11840 [Lewinellaceae bacterium SD302]
MIPTLRTVYNENFSQSRYDVMLAWLSEQHDCTPNFHVSETPIFISAELRDHLMAASADVTKVITAPGFSERAEWALLPDQRVPGRTPHPLFIQMDYGLCKMADGSIEPRLIEAQGFPSLYFFQELLGRAYRKYFDIPEGYGSFFNGLDRERYHELLRACILNGEDPRHVVLLEVEPEKQTTRIDFVVACDQLGIAELCISDLILEGRELFYLRDGVKTKVKRIFNRVIFDELLQRPDLERQFNMTEDVDVDWAGHPEWFFMLSKHTLPEFDSRYVPKSFFLSDPDLPTDLENYVLKPLYSFAGAGVVLNPTRAEINAVGNKDHYILQEKVEYAPLIKTLDEPARAEVRLMYLWPPDEPEPILVNNLVRLSKGKMIGVRYNKGKTWVGGSIGYFPQE